MEMHTDDNLLLLVKLENIEEVVSVTVPWMFPVLHPLAIAKSISEQNAMD